MKAGCPGGHGSAYSANRYGSPDPDGVYFRCLWKLAVLEAAAAPSATKHGGRDSDRSLLQMCVKAGCPGGRGLAYSANRNGGRGFIRWGNYQRGLWIRRPAESWRSWPQRPCCTGTSNMAANTTGLWIRRPAECWRSWPPRPCGKGPRTWRPTPGRDFLISVCGRVRTEYLCKWRAITTTTENLLTC